MAVKYKDVKKRSEELEMSVTDLDQINLTEKYIDDEIEKAFSKDSNPQVFIILSCVKFQYCPVDKTRLEIHPTIQRKMENELLKRYKNAGWNIEYEFGDVGPDYAIFTGKNN